jgi:uncharacterized membrane protein
MSIQEFSSQQKVAISLALVSIVGLVLCALGMARNHTWDFWYLPYNLLLGVIPLFLALGIRRLLVRKAWRHWSVVLLTVLWVLFLPNSFYIVSDFIHLTEHPRVDIVQDVVMLMQFSIAGLALGFTSLFIMHEEYKKKPGRSTVLLVGVLLLLSSFAIYLGRDLRWNSWDVFIRPLPLIRDVFEQATHPQLYITTLGFFCLLASVYALIWYAIAHVRGGAKSN